VAAYTCATEETLRTMPDCFFDSCTACTVVVPGQPACVSQSLPWNTESLYGFTGAGTVSADANPFLDIDNRRGCYSDELGMRVCTPENISIKHPYRSGAYTVAVHYWGEPVVQSGEGFTANRRGVAPAGLSSATFDVELYCKGVGFQRYRCANVPVNGWCFVADAQWTGSQCSQFATPTRTFVHAVVSGSGPLVPAFFDTGGLANVTATPAD
jgi:hypothetical protein